MATLTAGEGLTRSLVIDGDWSSNVSPAEYNSEIIISANATLLTFKNTVDSLYYEYIGNFKYTNSAPVGLAMGEVGLSGSVTAVDMFFYTNNLADKKLALSFKKLTLTMMQLYEADETGDGLLNSQPEVYVTHLKPDQEAMIMREFDQHTPRHRISQLAHGSVFSF